LEIQQGFTQGFQIGYRQGLDARFLGGRQGAETAAQLPQYQRRFSLPTVLLALLAAFGKGFLLEHRLFQVDIEQVQHGLNPLTGQVGKFVDQHG
jgi:hypothetical protein